MTELNETQYTEPYGDGIKTVIFLNGNLHSEKYTVNGKRHRTDGPSFVIYSEDGSVWCIDGLRQKTVGPVSTIVCKDGKSWCVNGCCNESWTSRAMRFCLSISITAIETFTSIFSFYIAVVRAILNL